jgi:hypothetical protein
MSALRNRTIPLYRKRELRYLRRIAPRRYCNYGGLD